MSRSLHPLGDHGEIIRTEGRDRKSDGSVFAVKITDWVVRPGISDGYGFLDAFGPNLYLVLAD